MISYTRTSYGAACIMAVLLVVCIEAGAQDLPVTNGGWSDFGVIAADSVVALDCSEAAAGSNSPLFYADMRTAFGVSFSVCFNTLHGAGGTLQGGRPRRAIRRPDRRLRPIDGADLRRDQGPQWRAAPYLRRREGHQRPLVRHRRPIAIQPQTQTFDIDTHRPRVR